MERRSYQVRLVPTSKMMTGVTMRRGRARKDTQGEGQGKAGRDWRDASTSQGVPRATRCWKRQGRILSKSLQREHGPADTSASDFLPLKP